MLSMFQADGAFALGLVALAVGMALVIWMRIHKDHTSKFCRGVAYAVVILAFLTLICTGYYTIQYWVSGYFSHPSMMMKSSREQMMMRVCGMKKMSIMQCGKQMMNQGKMVNQCTMMPQKMQPMQNSAMKPASKKMSASTTDHKAHHPGK